MSKQLVAVWRKIVGEEKSFVLFQYGTCVVVSGKTGDLAREAIELLKEWGPKHAGPKGGWTDVTRVNDSSGFVGWMVVGEHPDVLAFVEPEEGGYKLGPQIGLTGRTKRDRDSKELQVVHVENKKG